MNAIYGTYRDKLSVVSAALLMAALTNPMPA